MDLIVRSTYHGGVASDRQAPEISQCLTKAVQSGAASGFIGYASPLYLNILQDREKYVS